MEPQRGHATVRAIPGSGRRHVSPSVGRTHSGVKGRVGCERRARPFLLPTGASGQCYAFESVKGVGSVVVFVSARVTVVPGFKSNVTSTLTPFTSTTTGNLTGSGVSVLGLASGMASSVTAAAHAKQTFSKNLISFKNGGGLDLRRRTTRQ